MLTIIVNANEFKSLKYELFLLIRVPFGFNDKVISGILPIYDQGVIQKNLLIVIKIILIKVNAIFKKIERNTPKHFTKIKLIGINGRLTKKTKNNVISMRNKLIEFPPTNIFPVSATKNIIIVCSNKAILIINILLLIILLIDQLLLT